MSGTASARWRLVARAFGLAPALTVAHKLHPAHELSLVQDRSNSPAFRAPHLTLTQQTSGFRCEPCNFDAHIECATAPATVEHVNYAGEFVLCDDHVPQLNGCRYCAVCGRETLGYRYYNGELDIRLHPCCAVMPRSVDQDGRTFLLGYHENRMCGIKTGWPATRSPGIKTGWPARPSGRASWGALRGRRRKTSSGRLPSCPITSSVLRTA